MFSCTNFSFQGFGKRSTSFAFKRSDRRSSGKEPWVPKQNIFSSKTGRIVPANTKSFTFKQVCPVEQIQIRQHRDSYISTDARGLGSEIRSKGRIFSGAHKSTESAFTTLCGRPKDLSVQSPAFRTVLSPLSVHSSGKCSGRISKTKRNKHSDLSRRLVNFKFLKKRDHRSTDNDIADVVSPRVYSKSSEVRSDSDSKVPISGSNFRHCFKSHDSFSGEQTETATKSRQCLQVRRGDSTNNVGTVRFNELCITSSVERSTTHETSSNVASVEMETGSRSTYRQATDRPTSETSPSMVVGGKSLKRKEDNCRKNRINNSIGCFIRRLGRCDGEQSSKRNLDSSRNLSTYQQSRATRLVQLSEDLQKSNTRQDSSLPSRQLNSSLLFEEGGRNQIGSVMSVGVENTTLVRPAEYSDSSETSTRTSKCQSRSTESSISTHRVVTTSNSFQGYNEASTSSSNDRYVCNKSEQQVTFLLQSSDRSKGLGDRCIEPRLDRFSGIRISTNSNITVNPKKDKKRELSDHSYSAIVAKEIMVLNDSGTIGGDSIETSSDAKATGSKRVISHQPRAIQLSCLDAFRKIRTEKGFSVKAADYAGRCVRESSKQVYSAKWTIFVNWCCEQQVDPLKISAAELMEFFIHLLEYKSLSVSTIKGYRAAISHVLGRSYPACCEDMLTDLFKGFSMSAVQTPKNTLPRWDLPVVLYYIMQDHKELRCEINLVLSPYCFACSYFAMLILT